jgi:hypothetical protein
MKATEKPVLFSDTKKENTSSSTTITTTATCNDNTANNFKLKLRNGRGDETRKKEVRKQHMCACASVCVREYVWVCTYAAVSVSFTSFGHLSVGEAHTLRPASFLWHNKFYGRERNVVLCCAVCLFWVSFSKCPLKSALLFSVYFDVQVSLRDGKMSELLTWKSWA